MKPKEILTLYPALRHLNIKVDALEFTAIECAMQEYANQQLKQERNKAIDECITSLNEFLTPIIEKRLKALKH